MKKLTKTPVGQVPH